MTDLERAKIIANLRRWRTDHVAAVREIFNIEPDHWQVDALKLLGGAKKPRRKLGLKACTGPGKSALLAWEGWIRLLCYGEEGEHPKGIALSGEGRDNLRDNLWAELAKWQHRAPILQDLFYWNKEQIVHKQHPETCFLSARSYAKDADSEAIGKSLSGLHSRFPFVLLDEIGSMPVAVGQKASQIFTGGVADGLIIAAGNPTSSTGLLYHVCLTDIGWDIISITADPDDPKRTPRVDIEHAREQISLYGRENPWVMATILGLFPPQGFNSLFGLDDVEKAMTRHITLDQYNWSQKRMGVDVARFGDDGTVLAPRQGLRAARMVTMRGARTQEIAGRIQQARAKWEHELDIVDGSGGYGAGVVDALIQAGYPPIEFYGSGKANDVRYFNKRSECYFLLSEWVKRGGVLPKCQRLKRSLVAHTYTLQNGKLRVEEKDQIKKRLGFSPDESDALSMTFAIPDQPAAVRIPGQEARAQKVMTEYDPLKDA